MHVTWSVTPDPGAEASDAEKIAYYVANNHTITLAACLEWGVKTPLEVCKRTDDGGVTEMYFVDETLMRYFFHKFFGTDMDADLDTILEKACEMESDEVRVLVKHGELLSVVWQYPTYAVLVSTCYKEGQQAEELITGRIAQEAQQDADIQAQLTSLLARAPTRPVANMQAQNQQHLMAMLSMQAQAQQAVTQSIQDSALHAAQAGKAAAEAFGPTVCRCYRNLGYNCPECRKYG